MKPLAALLLGLLVLASPAEDAPRRALLISIDGLMPRDYLEPGTPAPTLRGLAADGVFAEGIVGVLPSLTFASHTSLITGVPPSIHGILDNRMFDPDGISGDAWYWYERDVKGRSLPRVARAGGLRVASIWWPATVGLEADAVVPEFWRSSHPETLSLLRALSSPRAFLDDVEKERGRPLALPITDRDKTDMALRALRGLDPHLLLLHLGDLDAARHEHGPDSPEAREALKRDDGYVAEIVAAVKAADRADRTTFVVVSDHGFLPLKTTLQPNAALKAAGLLTTDERGAIRSWQAYFHSSDGSGFIYAKSAEAAGRARQVIDGLKSDPASGIRTIWTAAELRALGAHPDAAFGIDMEDGFNTGPGHDVLLKPEKKRGGHGFGPYRPAMHASFIASGAAVGRRGSVGLQPMLVIAPTVARMIGVRLGPAVPEPLPLDGRTRIGR